MAYQIVIFTSLILSLHLFVGCGSTLVVRTEPSDAKISILAARSSEPKELGRSPIEVTDKAIMDIIKVNPNSGAYYEILIEKEGFDNETLVVPAARFLPMKTTLDVKLKSGNSEMRLASQMVQFLLNAQRFATKNEFERAQVEIDKALAIDSKFARAMTMRASIFFLQSRYQESLDWYEKAITVDSSLEEAVRMISEIKKKIGSSRTE